MGSLVAGCGFNKHDNSVGDDKKNDDNGDDLLVSSVSFLFCKKGTSRQG